MQLKNIQKLGQFFRSKYPDWKIVLLTNWRDEGDHFTREIVHEGGGKILAYAKVEVPLETFQHFRIELQNLGERSIGDHFLFVHENVRREPFEILGKKDEFPQGRRSHFWIEGLPLTITEYFTEEGLACFNA